MNAYFPALQQVELSAVLTRMGHRQLFMVRAIVRSVRCSEARESALKQEPSPLCFDLLIRFLCVPLLGCAVVQDVAAMPQRIYTIHTGVTFMRGGKFLY
jgi:hypothetical protein